MTGYISAIAIGIASALLLITPVWADRLDNGAHMQGDPAQPDVRSPGKHQSKVVIRRADSDEQLRHKLRDQANKGLVGVISEGTDETTDIAFALASEGVRLLPISGAGASQNVTDVLFTRGIDFGIIQTDVLDEIQRNPPFPGVGKYLEYVTKLYDEQLHVLAGPDIQSLSDLQGKKVNFGRRNSGTYTTATNIFKALGVQPNVTTLPHPLALNQLRRGEISAMVYVATKPSRMFQDIRPDEKLHFLAVTGKVPREYAGALITNDDYPELVSQIAPVQTVEVGTVLVAYNWPEKSERYARVNHFVQAFFTHLNEIRAIHPKWQPFDVTSEVSGWTRFPGAERWLKRAGLITKSDQAAAAQLDPNQCEQLFRAFADYEKHAAQLDPSRREELFRAFAEYEKQHQTIVAFHDIAAQ